MANTDFYKSEIERLQERLKDWQRVRLEASGLLSKLGSNALLLETDSDTSIIRKLFDKTESLNIKYKETVAELMFIQGALDELIQAANIELSDAWVDVSDGCGDDCTEFSLYQSAVPRLVKYLKQRECCGDARCHNQDSGVDCAQDSPIPGMTKLLDDEGVYDRKVLE